MGIKLTNLKDIEKFLERSIQERETIIINRLHRVGLKFVTDARTKDREEGYYSKKGATLTPASQGYFDWTGQLRASIGYFITKNGIIIESDFTTDNIKTKGDLDLRDLGKKEGEALAQELTKNVQGYALICVAGADYAYHVESNGYDVITGSSITAEQNLKKYFK
ncbi:MAG: hypothetical protein ACRCVU_20125 [Flavobacterium sp.]